MPISEEFYSDLQPLLFSLAYRMLGSSVDAEDIVHETFLVAFNIDEEKVSNLKAYVCKIATNKCLDYLKSAQKQKETYIGPWLPQPLVLKSHDHPYLSLIEKEDLSMAYLKLMELLSPKERAVLLLREAMALDYEDIADILQISSVNCRKLLSRGKKKLKSEAYESKYSVSENNQVVLQFLSAFQAGQIEKLLKMIDENVVLYSDGGGNVTAALNPIQNRKNVLAFLSGIYKKRPDNYTYKIEQVNGQTGTVNFFGESIQSTISFEVRKGKIHQIFLVMNPDKLTNIYK